MGTKFFLTVVFYLLATLTFEVFGVIESERNNSLFGSFTLKKFIMIALLVPFVEEFFFRYWLIKPWGVLYVFPMFLFAAWWIYIQEVLQSYDGVVFGTLLFFLALYLFVIRRIQAKSYNKDILIQRVFPYAYWSSVTLFAIAHLSNYAEGQMGYFVILLVLPQFISGTYYGYICGRYGFLAAFLCHGIWNGTLMIMAMQLVKM